MNLKVLRKSEMKFRQDATEGNVAGMFKVHGNLAFGDLNTSH